MSEYDAFLAALRPLGPISVEMITLEHDQPEGWKYRLLALRRDLQSQLSLINATAKDWIAAHGDTQGSRQLRELLSRLRALLAEHQASWPVVAIIAGDPPPWPGWWLRGTNY